MNQLSQVIEVVWKTFDNSFENFQYYYFIKRFKFSFKNNLKKTMKPIFDTNLKDGDAYSLLYFISCYVKPGNNNGIIEKSQLHFYLFQRLYSTNLILILLAL